MSKSRSARSGARRGRPPGSSADATRQSLLLAAARHFSTAEYSEVSLRAIALECGITGAAIYNHFSSKEELFVSVTEHMMTVNGQAIEQAIATRTDWRSMLEAVFSLIRKDPTGYFRFPMLIPAVQLKIMRKPEEFPSIVALRTVFVESFVKIIDRAIAAGDLPPGASRQATAELLLAFTFNGLGAVMAHRKSEEGIAELVDSAAMLLTVQRKA